MGSGASNNVDMKQLKKTYEMLVERYSDYVYNLIYYTLLNEEEARDLTQDIFLKIWKGLANFRGNSSYKTWIYRITVNHINSYLRKKRIRRFLSLEFLHEKSGFEPHVEMNTEKDHLEIAMEKLPEHMRTVLVLFYLENYDIKEIANILGVKEGTVKSRLSRARQALKEVMGG